MLDKLDKIIPMIRIFFPEQRRWVTRFFLLAGVPLVAGQLWEPYANALLSRYLDVRIPVEAATYTGWTLIVLALIILAINETLDRLPKKIAVTPTDKADRKSLVALFSQIHIPTLDSFVHYGKLSMTYDPTFHYFYGVEGYVTSANFHIHDNELKNKILALYDSLNRALSFGAFFRETSNANLFKFDSRHDIHRDPSAKAAHDGFIKAVLDTEDNIRSLCKTTQEKFPDFNFDVTNDAAIQNYRMYQTATEV